MNVINSICGCKKNCDNKDSQKNRISMKERNDIIIISNEKLIEMTFAHVCTLNQFKTFLSKNMTEKLFVTKTRTPVRETDSQQAARSTLKER